MVITSTQSNFANPWTGEGNCLTKSIRSDVSVFAQRSRMTDRLTDPGIIDSNSPQLVHSTEYLELVVGSAEHPQSEIPTAVAAAASSVVTGNHDVGVTRALKCHVTL